MNASGFRNVSETHQIRIALLVSFFCYLATTPTSAQIPPPSALVNQRSADTLEAARAASPHTPDETSAYFEDEAELALEQAIARVWDPERPREPSPRKSWGHPDIEGYWVSATYTPMERPAELEGKPFYVPQEAIETFQRAVLGDVATDPAVVHYDWTEFGMDNWQSPIRPNLRTSLIVDPPNGRKPPLTENGQAQFAANAPRHTLESRNLYERCITGDQGPPRVPSTQAVGESQIVQTPEYVLLITQVNSEVRIIHLDDEPQESERVGSFLGYSHGRWEGDTLVVETSNFGTTARVRRIQEAGPNLHLLERFTRVEDDLLLYEATLTDPTVWESAWTYEVPWPRMDPPGLFEWACHENNYGFINVVRGARVRAAEFAAEQDNNP